MMEENIEQLYVQALSGNSDFLLPRVKYKCFISRSKGAGRKRIVPVEIELVSFGNGEYHKLREDLVDGHLAAAFEDFSIPADMTEYNYLVELLRSR